MLLMKRVSPTHEHVWWWCRWRRRHPWSRRSMSRCKCWDISGARLSHPASSVSNGIVVIVEVGSRCRAGEIVGGAMARQTSARTCNLLLACFFVMRVRSVVHGTATS